MPEQAIANIPTTGRIAGSRSLVMSRVLRRVQRATPRLDLMVAVQGASGWEAFTRYPGRREPRKAADLQEFLPQFEG